MLGGPAEFFVDFALNGILASAQAVAVLQKLLDVQRIDTGKPGLLAFEQRLTGHDGHNHRGGNAEKNAGMQTGTSATGHERWVRGGVEVRGKDSNAFQKIEA